MQPISNSDQRARRIVKALEPILRRQLGSVGVEREFVTGLYWRLRQALEDAEGLASETGTTDPQRLGFEVYLFAATDLEDCKLTPTLLSSVTKEIEAVLHELARRPSPVPRT